MNKLTLKQRIADNINQLSADGATVIDGRVTGTAIENKINDIYRYVLFPILGPKFPQFFEQRIYPEATYIATGTINVSTSGTTLVLNESVFDNTMERLYVQNPTRDSSIRIETYTNATTVTLESTVATDSWTAGDTVYVLGNIYTIDGDLEDLHSIISLQISYTGSDTDYKDCERVDEEDYYRASKALPKFALTSVDVNGQNKPAIKFDPTPDSHLGRWKGKYLEVPEALNETDSPILSNQGISELIINGVTAWALRLKGENEAAAQYEEADRRTGQIYPKGTKNLLRAGVKSRSGNLKIRKPTLNILMKSRLA